MEKINRVSLRLLSEKKDLVGVEIGVNQAVNAVNILENLDIKKLYLVDPYIAYEHYTQEKVDGWKKVAYNNLEKYKDKIELIEKKSIEAINFIPNNLDFVYIDGDHQYKSVWKDLNFYFDKIKKGGLLCGDNFECITVRCAIYDFLVFEKNNEFPLSGIGPNKTTETIDWWIWV